MKTSWCVCGKEIECEWATDKKVLGSLICPDCLKKRSPVYDSDKPSVIERLKSIANGDSLKNCTHQVSLVEQMNEDNRFVQDQLKDLIWLAEKMNILLNVAVFDENIPSHALVNRCSVRIIKTALDHLFRKEEQ